MNFTKTETVPMIDFINALFSSEITFLRYAFIAGILSSFAFGIVGSYVVARRISYIAGAIAHSVLGGIGVGLYLQKGLGVEWFDPIYGAILSALAAAVTIGFVSIYAKEREDSVIGAIWAIGMAVGLLFIAKTPGYIDPMSYLFGNILMITANDLWLIAILDLVIIGLSILFYSKILAVCFDEEFASLRGIKVKLLYFLILCLTALTVVLLVRIVGIVLVIALLTLPAAISGMFTRYLWQMMLFSIIFCVLFTSFGIGISYSLDFPSGPTIIVLAGFVYLIFAVVNFLKKRAIS